MAYSHRKQTLCACGPEHAPPDHVTPKVSVCIPAKNAAPFIAQALDSVAGQTYRDWELVIVENCSTDSTHDAISAWLETNPCPRVAYHRNTAPLGMAENWNRALGFCSGRMIKVICADDFMLPGCLATQVAALDQFPEASFAACARKIVGPRGNHLFDRCGFPRTGLYQGPVAARHTLRAAANLIGDPVSVLFRREVLSAVGAFRPEIVYFTDIDLWLRMLPHGPMWFDSTPACCYRVHGNATTTAVRAKMAADFALVLDSAAELDLYTPTRTERAYLNLRVHAMNFARGLIYRLAGR